MRSIYLHFPFCASKCAYCDFVSGIPARPETMRRYTDALLRELSLQRAKYGEIEGESTLYLGGGTPSLAPLQDVERWISAAREMAPGGFAEITLEANPEDVTASLAAGWKALGIHRVSLGWQSQNAATLALFRRRNSPESNIRALATLRKAGFSNVSVDVIAGVTGDDLEATLSEVLNARPEHVSAYLLTLSEGTPLTLAAERGEYLPLPEDETLRAFREVHARLSGAGYVRSEVSNWSRGPEFVARHNRNYWKYGEYLGAGLSASGFVRPEAGKVEGTRWTNVDTLDAYFARLDGGELPVAEEDPIDRDAALREFFMLALRTADGARADEFRALFGTELKDAVDPGFFEKRGEYFEHDADGFRLTGAGFEIMNALVVELWENLTASPPTPLH